MRIEIDKQRKNTYTCLRKKIHSPVHISIDALGKKQNGSKQATATEIQGRSWSKDLGTQTEIQTFISSFGRD